MRSTKIMVQVVGDKRKAVKGEDRYGGKRCVQIEKRGRKKTKKSKKR